MLVNVNARGNADGSIDRYINSRATTSLETYTYETSQDNLTIRNVGLFNLFLNVGTLNVTIKPNETWSNDVTFTNFTISSEYETCELQITAKEYDNKPLLRKDNVGGVSSELLETINKNTSDLAHNVQQVEDSIISNNERIDNLVIPISATNTNIEVTDSHVSAVKNKTFTSVKNRFEESENDVLTNIKNLVVKGDFSGGIIGWSATSTSTLSLTDKTLSIVGTGTGAGVLRKYSQAMNVSANDQVFIKMRGRVTNPNATNMQMKLIGSVSGTVAFILNQANPIENQWYDVVALLTLPSNFSGNVQFEISHGYVDATTATNKVLELQYMLLTDLTKDYGIGNEPTLEEMNILLGYFDNGWFDVSMPVGLLTKNLSKDLITLKREVASSTGGKADKLYLKKYNDSTYYVYYKPKGSKWVRHEFYRYVYPSQYADVWVTQEITTGYDTSGKFPDESGFVFTIDTPVTSRGSSHEFSYRIVGDDYRGTRHGCETFDYFKLLCDGVPTTLTNGQCKMADRISLYEESHLLSIADGTTVQLKVFKEWNFDQRGLDYRLSTEFITPLTLSEGLTLQNAVMVYDASVRATACRYYSYLTNDNKTYDLSLLEIPSPNQSYGYVMWNDISGLSFKSYVKDDWKRQFNDFANLEDGNNLRPTGGTGFRKTYFTRLYNPSGEVVNVGEIWEFRTRTEVFLKE